MVHGAGAEVIESGEVGGGDVAGEAILFHFFVATLDCIGVALSDIDELLLSEEARARRYSLADDEEDVQTQVMVVFHGCFEVVAAKIAPATGGVAEAHPVNAGVVGAGVRVNTQDSCWIGILYDV